MAETRSPEDRRAARPPLDRDGLERLAIGYVGRYATSRARLVQYLVRKLRERGWEGESTPDPSGVADRLAALGYVDDRALADARGQALARRGFGRRRVAAAVDALGIDRADAADALAEAERDAWTTALRFAERKRLGPFARAAATDPAAHRRAFGAMARAGHAPRHIARILAAPPGVLPEWDGN